jgi:hypothetical protein
MGFFREVFSKAGIVTVVEEGRLVFFVSYGELSACLANIRLVAIRANQLVYHR